MKKIVLLALFFVILFQSNFAKSNATSNEITFLDSCTKSLLQACSDAKLNISAKVARQYCQMVLANDPPEMRDFLIQQNQGCEVGVNIYWLKGMGYSQEQLISLSQKDSHLYDKYCK